MKVWNQGVVYMRHIGSDGKGYIESHQCWNTVGFITKRHEEANRIKRQAEAKGEVDHTRAEVVTQADYRAERWVKRG